MMITSLLPNLRSLTLGAFYSLFKIPASLPRGLQPIHYLLLSYARRENLGVASLSATIQALHLPQLLTHGRSTIRRQTTYFLSSGVVEVV